MAANAPTGKQFEQAAKAAPQSSPFDNPEFVAVLSNLKRMGAALAGVTGDSPSALGRAINTFETDQASASADVQAWQSAAVNSCIT